ncbi:hypothetical protein PPERSA_06324 [Pseudocohnilembus persalinus]|uniref:Peptidase M20 dimerisation domain-containing protein n=1 Tax=Pseudocohnilembus persalinus TaxID=266149 RepID=A0A0V0QIJ4_PSEPJ|nr:hypothetical protein PPERSA_06324 [Pseudocohnilembus persalinus]|eukprot:KRX02129.1 hypothetical protein PPERSA_06324 [Pseudocohnilembus persalinus]
MENKWLIIISSYSYYQNNQRPPLVFIEIEGTLNNDTTCMFYGHFDKQPHFTGWKEGLAPTEPVIRDGYLFGRGSVDDGYAAFSTITCIRTLQNLGIPHPRCVITIEGEEESGSEHYMSYIEELKEKIGQPSLIFCLDSGCLDYKTLWITSSLRGYIDGNLTVSVAQQGVHSGASSGLIPSSFRIIRQILDRFEDSKTGQVHENYHVKIPPHRYEECYKVADQLGDKIYNQFPYFENTQPVTKNNLEGYLNNTWRPTISYIGADGMPPTQTAGNVLRPYTTIGVSMRTPPTLPSKEKAKEFKELVESNPPYNATVKYDLIDAGNGWDAPKYLDFLNESIQQAANTFFGQDYKSQGMGGSIPLMNELQNIFPKAQFLVTGCAGPDTNSHGPNECLNLDYLKKIICCMTKIIADSELYGAQFPK